MSYKIETLPGFEKDAKRLAKKYPSLKTDLSSLINSLETNPQQGTPLGNDFYKVRLANSSKGKGKSGRSKSNYLCKNYSIQGFPCGYL